MNNTLIFGKDSFNNNRAMKCTSDGRIIIDVDPSNDLATETTLRQVKTAIENIDVNVGDITLGDIAVSSNDTTTHEKLDINNGLISSTNIKLDTINSSINNKTLNKNTSSIDISGQTISISNTGFNVDNQISNYALETGGNLAGIKSQVDTLSFITVGPTDFLQVYDTNSKAVLDNIKTNTDALDNFSFTNDAGIINLNTHDKLTSEAINEKHLDKTTDSVDITNQNINVNMSIESSSYDLLINGPTLWADSLPVGNPFFADPNGREGWYYDNNSNINNRSNIYWYGNPTSGNLQENDMAFSQLSNMYSVITCDYVDNGSLTIPTMGIYSQPTGTNDFIPTFAHSRWVYQLSAGDLSKLRKGETILIYTGATRPDVFNELPSYQLNLVLQNGDALGTEIIGYMSINTQATTSKIGYLLQYAGYINSAVVGNNLLPINRMYGFKNSKERVVQNNLYSGSFAVSNFPATQPVSGSVSVSNFPATQAVSGTVAVSTLPAIGITNTSFEVSNFPASQPVSGSVSVSNLPATQPVSGSVSVSNFPATQAVSGTVAVSTLPAIGITNTSFEVSNFPASQPISGSVSVSNLPATQPVSGSVSISNLPATQPVSGTVAVSTLPAIGITNTSFESKTQDGSGNGITSTSIDAKRDLDVAADLYANFGSNRQRLTCDSLGGLRTFTVIRDSVGDALTSTLIGAKQSLDVSVSNLPATQPVSGTVAVSNSFTLDTTTQSTNTKLDTIHNDLDGLTFDGSSNLNVNVVAGSITVSSVNIKDSAGNSLSSVGGSLNSNITNTSIDTHCYGSSDGTIFHHLKTTVTGNLITESKTHDGNNTAITSTLNGAKQSLDVNVANTPTVGLSSGSVIKITDGVDNADVVPINSNMTTPNGLVVASALYGRNTANTSSIPLTTTLNSAKQSLDVHVSNTVGVSGTVGISGEVNLTEDNRVLLGTNAIGGGVSTLTSTNPPSTDANIRALHTFNYNQAYNNDTGIYLPITTKSIGGTTALNVFNIPAETKQYTFGGIDNNATSFRIIGGNATSPGIPLDGATGYNFGLANARVYRASLSTGTPNSNLYIDYIEGATGNLIENSGPYAVVATSNATNWTLLPSMIGGPIKFRTSTTIGSILSSTHSLYISPDTDASKSIGHSGLANYGVAVFTIPNGYIGYITALTAGYATAGSVIMVKWGADGIRQVVYKVNIETSLNIVVPAGYEGMLGGIFTAGESIAFTNNLATSAKLVQASITLRQI